MRLIILVCSILPLYSLGLTITNFNFQNTTYTTYEKAQATFSLSQTYTNPYNPTEITVDALVTLPNGTIVAVPCFYYIPASISGSNATENMALATWMLRYTPTVTGRYSAKIRATDISGTVYSSTVSFAVAASTKKGFIRINSSNKQFMKFDNGTPYYPVGMNVCWNNGPLLDFYKAYTDSLSNNKSSWMRYWLTDFARQSLEWSASHWSGWYSGLGVYSQKAAGMLDSVLNMCEQKNIYMQLVLQHHGQFSTNVNPEWSGNPYNTANGGILTSPSSFFSNTSAKAQTKKLYRYIVARWGYCTNILSWELFNEVEYTTGASDANIDAWHDEMSHFLKSTDVNQHIVNTSSGDDNSTLALLDNNTAIDQLQYHTYTANIEKATYNASQGFLNNLTKPIVCGEFGTTDSYANHPDNWGDHVRKSQWIGMFSEVPNMFWFWDTYIDAKNLYTIFKPLGNFLNGIDIVAETGGHAGTFNFSANSSTAIAVNAVPLMNWGTSTQNDFVVGANGTINGLNNKSTYLQGGWNAAMGNYASFTVNFHSAGKAFIDVSSISTVNGSETVQILIDGVSAGTHAFAGAGTFSVNVTAGSHVIKYTVTTNDWVNVSRYGFTNVASNALTAYGYHGNTKAYGYINDNGYGQWENPLNVSSISSVTLKVGTLIAGNYNVEYMDPQSGATITGTNISTSNDTLHIVLPTFKKDLAFKVSPNVSIPTSLSSVNSTINGVIVYPNPASNEFYIKANVSFPYDIELYDITGKKSLKEIITNSDQKINSANLSKGIYLYKIISKNNKQVSGKIVIE